MDLKAPASGESDKNLWKNRPRLNARDEIKIVLADEADYEWARKAIRERKLDAICPVLLAPVAGKLDAKLLAEWCCATSCRSRALQLHKLIWGAERGR